VEGLQGLVDDAAANRRSLTLLPIAQTLRLPQEI